MPPPATTASSSADDVASLCSWWLTTRPPITTPSRAASARRRRVSSAATTSASASSRRRCADASSELPIGVAASTSRPGAGASTRVSLPPVVPGADRPDSSAGDRCRPYDDGRAAHRRRRHDAVTADADPSETRRLRRRARSRRRRRRRPERAAPRRALVATLGAAPTSDAEPEENRPRLLRLLLGTDTLTLDDAPRARLMGWLWPLAVTLLAGLLRFWDLGRPHRLVFDETYYVKDAWSLLVNGYEANWADNPNPAFEAGDVSGLGTTGEYVVHPQVGKWLIALGIHFGGGIGSSTAWRLSAAICGTLAVLMVARIGRRLFASTALGTRGRPAAGGRRRGDRACRASRCSTRSSCSSCSPRSARCCWTATRPDDGSPTARPRCSTRARQLGWGPGLGVRWWRLAAAVLLGLGLGTKWSAMYFLAVFGLLSVALGRHRPTHGRRPAVGLGGHRQGRDRRRRLDGVHRARRLRRPAGGRGSRTRSRTGASGPRRTPARACSGCRPALRSFWKYHQDMWAFHNGLETPHAYAAHPLGWIVQWRPTSMFYPTEISGLTGQQAQDACGASSCSQAITALGNPILWWCATAAILVARRLADPLPRLAGGCGAVGHRRGLAAVVRSTQHRTIFTFYSIVFTPWIVLTLTYVMGLVVGPKDLDPVGRRRAIIGCGVLVGLIVLVGAFFYPIWSAWVMPYKFWHMHMWLQTWI